MSGRPLGRDKMSQLRRRVFPVLKTPPPGDREWRGYKIDTSKWKKFHLYDDNLFEIDSGTKLDRVKMTDYKPSVNFVGRANANNGATDYIDVIPGLKPYDAWMPVPLMG